MKRQRKQLQCLLDTSAADWSLPTLFHLLNFFPYFSYNFRLNFVLSKRNCFSLCRLHTQFVKTQIYQIEKQHVATIRARIFFYKKITILELPRVLFIDLKLFSTISYKNTMRASKQKKIIQIINKTTLIIIMIGLSYYYWRKCC